MQVSVVIATQNVAKFIGKCLASLVPYYKQNYIEEIIVVDGQSTDGTLNIVRRYPVKLIPDKFRNPYVLSIPQDKGWRVASGQLVMFIDSDAYIGKGFFPKVLEFFEDKTVGGVGCRQIHIPGNNIMRTIGEWWNYHFDSLKNLEKLGSKPQTFIHKIYCKAVGFSDEVVISGPCYLVRRECLEAVGGFDELSNYGCEDIRLSQRITKAGWKVKWWFEAPVYHYPPNNIKSLIKQRYFWGQRDGYPNWKSADKWYSKLLPAVIRLGTPVVGLRLAIRYKNPLHLFLFPLAHYAWVVGYLSSFARSRIERNYKQK